MVPPVSIDRETRPVDYAAMSCRARTAAGGLLLLASLAAAGRAFGQPAQGGTISDPPATFVRRVAGYGAAPVADFKGVSADLAANHLFETGWWYRIAGGTQEKFFPTPNEENYVGDTSTVTWNAIEGAFRAVETNVVTNGGGPSGQVIFSLTLTNLSAATPLSIDVFNMTDFDLGGTSEADQADLLSANHLMRVTDGVNCRAVRRRGGRRVPRAGVPGEQRAAGRAGQVERCHRRQFRQQRSSLPSRRLHRRLPVDDHRHSALRLATFVAGIAVNMALTFPAAPRPPRRSRRTSTTTTTTLDTELCDNCSDDDGDGLVDFEDPDCCATPAPLTLRKSTLRPRGVGVAKLKLTAKLATGPVADGHGRDAGSHDPASGLGRCASVHASLRGASSAARRASRSEATSSARTASSASASSRSAGARSSPCRGATPSSTRPRPGRSRRSSASVTRPRRRRGTSAHRAAPSSGRRSEGVRYP
jgi:hypothetical protein